jgi:hypothetical protein
MADDTGAALLPSAHAVFAQLTQLVGPWHGTTASGHALTVAYRLVAARTVLVETWMFASGDEALTLYYCDGPHLLATHYCPLGNQPRLRWQPAHDPRHVFTCFDATNLPTPATAHQQQFVIHLLSPTTFLRSETYAQDGRTSTEAVTYHRTLGARATVAPD